MGLSALLVEWKRGVDIWLTRQLVYVHLFQDGKEIAVETRCADCAKDLMEYKK